MFLLAQGYIFRLLRRPGGWQPHRSGGLPRGALRAAALACRHHNAACPQPHSSGLELLSTGFLPGMPQLLIPITFVFLRVSLDPSHHQRSFEWCLPLVLSPLPGIFIRVLSCAPSLCICLPSLITQVYAGSGCHGQTCMVRQRSLMIIFVDFYL